MSLEIEIIAKVFIGLIGLCIGSFLNVLIYRLPLDMSIISPPSHCPQCNAKIKWYDNIPLLSYIILRGKCRTCGEKIPFRYFFVELLNIALWAAVLALFDLSVYSVIYALLSSVLLAVFFIDAEHKIIPDSLNIAIAVLGVTALVYSVFDPVIGGITGDYEILWWERLAGSAGAGLVFAAIFYFYKWVRKKEGIGGGDVKMIAALGLVLGYKLILLCVGLSALFACVYLLIKKLKGELDAQEPFAYGPFISAAAYLSAIIGNYVIALYLGLF